MDIENILKSTLKVSRLILLTLSLNSCSSQKTVIENYLEALKQENIQRVRSYCSEERANVINWEAAIPYIKERYKDVIKIHSYIPYEGKNRDNIYWMEHLDGRHSPVLLVDEGGWKIDEVGPPINPTIKKEKPRTTYI